MFSIYNVFCILCLCEFNVSADLISRNGSTLKADERNEMESMQEKTKACNDGYTGNNCTFRCRYPSYGKDCQKMCNCKEDICDIATGCQDGVPTFSVQVHPTNVKNDAGVQIPTPATACKNGYTGSGCDLHCIYPGFGAGCQSECNCSMEQCDHIRGCNYSTLDTGCQYPTYGKDCQMECDCEEMYCNATNGCIVTNTCDSDERHRNQSLMFSTVILWILALIQFSVYFHYSWSQNRS